ncbi:MAG: DUF2905 domain-containing protein [Ignavibacteriaceae bacterium]|jgi:hypothetical protein
MQRILLFIGALIILAGLFWPWLSKLPLGHLPGDIVIDKPNFKLFIPITSMLLISALISFILWIVRKL